VAIVNESFARKFFGGPNAIGRTFQVEEPTGEPRPLYAVIAVVKDTKYTDLREPFGPIGYFAASQMKPDPFLQVILRLNRPSAMVTAQVTQVVAEVNRAISVSYQTMRETVEQSPLRERLMATLSGFFGALAALLAAAGAVLAVVAGRAAATLLFGLKPGDPLTLAAAIAPLTGIAAAATLVPAVRARASIQRLRSEKSSGPARG
jgi:putative ABC transport system permease protein